MAKPVIYVNDMEFFERLKTIYPDSVGNIGNIDDVFSRQYIEFDNYYIEQPIKHQTEEKYPEQTKRFREILEEMYQTHLQKNADYSPYNILVTGMKGCVTRLWDKSARFFNLMGLDIGKYTWNEEKMNTVADEPVEQTLIDWANYCIITRILREGKWGK
jgi:hypothetical protein